MAWLSPSFPVGAFSYSSGLEWAVEAGDVTDAATLQRWLRTVIAHGNGFCDGVFFVHAYRAVASGDEALLHEVAELAAAFAPSKERQLETTAQGHAFLQTARAAWSCDALQRFAEQWRAPLPIRSPSRWRPPGTAFRLSRRCMPICMRSSPI